MSGSAGYKATLLSDATATGSGVMWPGGRAAWITEGTFGGGTATLQMQTARETWVTTGATSTANEVELIDLVAGTYRVSLAGGSGFSGMYSELVRL